MQRCDLIQTVCAQVEFSVENSTFHLLVDGVRVPDGQLPGNEGLSLRLRNPVYLGGHPKKKTTKVHIKLEQSYHSLLICIFLLTTATKLKKKQPIKHVYMKGQMFPRAYKKMTSAFSLWLLRDTTFPQTASSAVYGISK